MKHKKTKGDIVGDIMYVISLLVYIALLLRVISYMVDGEGMNRFFAEETLSMIRAIFACGLAFISIYVSIIYERVMYKLFASETEEEKKLKEDIKKINETMSKRKARFEIRRLMAKYKHERRLKHINEMEKRR